MSDDYDFTKDDSPCWKEMLEEIETPTKEELQERIFKAIEYINKFDDISAYYEYIDEDGYNECFDVDFKKDMLALLKGVDKE